MTMHPVWGYLISALTGALLTAFGFYITLFGKVKDVEAKHEQLRKEFEAEQRRTDARIDGVREAAREVLETARETIGLVKTLVIEIQAERRAHEQG